MVCGAEHSVVVYEDDFDTEYRVVPSKPDMLTSQAERMERKESKHRNVDAATNLALFEALLKAETPEAQKYCMRAKIDMTSVNGTMRDPVLYRCVAITKIASEALICYYGCFTVWRE